MVCENYVGWLKEAVVGQLSPSRHAKLIAHVGKCEACREAYTRAQRAVALVDQGIDALVAGDPSPQFAVELRARIADEQTAGRAAWAWRFPVGASAIVLAGIATIATISSLRHDMPRPPVSSVASISSRRATGATSVGHHPAVIRRPHSEPSHTRAVFSVQEPEILVAPGQMEALRRLDEAPQQHLADRTQAVAHQEELARPLEVKPLDVKSLEVSKIDDLTDLSGGF
ncbi:MAG: hypothetical protein ACRD3Q_02945 [Terriglobales bacterium]